MNFNFLTDTNFDFERTTFRYSGSIIYIDAYFIPEDEVCPCCGSSSLYKNGHITKTVKHCVYYTKLLSVTCHIQCYKCKECKTIFREKDTFSKESKFAILDKLKQANATFESVANDLHLSKQNVIDVFDRYVDYHPPSSLPKIMCFDEKHINKKMTDSTYQFIIVDFINIKIYDILQSRHKYALEKYFSKISIDERKKVQYIVMDMWEPYLDVAKKYFKDAIIAIDSFHVMEAINNAMSKIRLSVMQKYNNNTENIDDNDPYYYVLKKYRYFFTKEFDDISNKRFYSKKLKMWIDKHSLKDYIFSIDERLEKAYKLTEKYREFNKTASFENADKDLSELIDLFYSSRLTPFIDVSKTLSNWKEYIVNSFIVIPEALNNEDKPRRLSNGPIEGLNSTLEKINVNANGYSNFFRFRNRSIYVINKDVPIQNTPLKNNNKIKKQKK